MRPSNSTSGVSTPQTTNIDGTLFLRTNTSSAPSPVDIQPNSAISSEGGGLPDNHIIKNPPISFGGLSFAPQGSQINGSLTGLPSNQADSVNVHLRDMLQRTNLGSKETTRPTVNGYRA
jgi:hypothetical protein